MATLLETVEEQVPMPTTLMHKKNYDGQMVPLGRDRRVMPRYHFTAAAEALDPQSRARMTARTSDISRGGCYVDTFCPFPKNASVKLRIVRDKEFLVAQAKVVYSKVGMGMGLCFTALEQAHKRVLDKWISELSGATPAEFEDDFAHPPHASSHAHKSAMHAREQHSNGAAHGSEGHAMEVHASERHLSASERQIIASERHLNVVHASEMATSEVLAPDAPMQDVHVTDLHATEVHATEVHATEARSEARELGVHPSELVHTRERKHPARHPEESVAQTAGSNSDAGLVVGELIIALMRRGTLSTSEGNSLLQKLIGPQPRH